MITLHEAILELNPAIKVICGDVAYDKDENVVSYDKAQAEAKLAEMQAAKETTKQAQEASKASALAKLAALGLTQDEVKSLIG